MTKFNEITDVPERKSKIDYIDEVWASWRESRLQTLTRITSYLFILNTGASLTYVASKQNNSDVQISIWLFSAGILCSVLHATLDYYLTENWFAAYQKDVEELYDNKLDWEDFVDKENNRVSYDWILHMLGWIGAIVFFVGLISGVLQL